MRGVLAALGSKWSVWPSALYTPRPPVWVTTQVIAYWNSPVIEAITIVLMVAGGTNFLLLFLLLRGKLKAFLTHIETPLYFGTIAVMALVVAGFFLGQGPRPPR